MKNLTELETRIRERLDEIKAVPPRNPRVAAHARARFLTQAREASAARQRSGWGFIFRQRQFAMNMAVALVMLVGLFVGGTTVRAAQDDLPNEPLYIVKTWSEDISLKFANGPEAKAERLMELAQTRVEEMAQLIEAGQIPPEQVQLRFEQHLQQAFRLSSKMEDAALDKTLLQMQHLLKQQEHDVQALQAHAAPNAQPVLERMHTMLETHLQVVDAGLHDHQAFRDQVNNGLHSGQSQVPPTSAVSTPPEPATSKPGNPGNGVGPNPTPEATATEINATPENNGNHPTPGNNAGGNNKDKKDKEKEKEPKGKDPGKKP